MLHGEGLDDALAGYGLVEKVREPRHGLLVLGAVLSQLPAEGDDGIGGDGKDDESDDREPPVTVEDYEDEADYGEGVLQYRGERIGDRALDEGDVVRDAGDDGAGGSLVEKGEGLHLEALEDEVPDVRDDLLSDEAHEVCLEVVAGALCEDEEDDAERDDEQHGAVLFEEYLVHDGLHQIGHEAVRAAHEGHEDHGEDELHPVRSQELKQS